MVLRSVAAQAGALIALLSLSACVSNQGGRLDERATPHPRTVDIRWTQYDAPHIQANDYESLGFGYGYVLANDRLCESTGRALAFRGGRSSVYGADGRATVGFLQTTNLNSDLFYRMRAPEDRVLAEFEKLSPETQEYILGVAAGMNHYVNNMPDEERATRCKEEPILEFRVTDIVRAAMIFGVMKEAVAISHALVPSATEWNTTQHASFDHPDHLLPAVVEGGFGSNAWAYGGDVTENDAGILLALPHSAWKRNPHQQRIYMHQTHLTIPGELDVAGAAFLGVPTPMTGFNKDVAWTILDAASTTAYVLQAMDVRESDTAPTYIVDGIEKPLTFKTISLEIKGDDGEVTTQTFKFIESELGVLFKLPESHGHPAGWYAITNAGQNNGRGLDQFFQAARASSTKEFTDIIAENRGILSQLIVADRNGDIGYVVAGNVVDISDEEMLDCHLEGVETAFNVIDGTRADCAFRDAEGNPLNAPLSSYPTLLSRGILHNTNNSYKYTEFGEVQRPYASMFGHHSDTQEKGHSEAAGLRYDPRLPMSYRRMSEISEDGVVTPEEALQVVFDNRNFAAETFLDSILALCEQSDDSDVATGCSVLATWDRKNNSDSQGALLFHQFWNRVVKMRPIMPVNPQGNPDFEQELDLNPEAEIAILDAIGESVRELASFGFEPDAPWGSALYAIADGEKIPLNGGSYQEGVLNGEMPAPLTTGGFPFIMFGTVFVERVTWENGSVNPDIILVHGQREDIDSDGRTQQINLFSNKQLYPAPFTESELAEETIYRTISFDLDALE